MARLETGVVQEGDDWPGVFIRGDNAMAYAMSLDAFLSGRDTWGTERAMCENLAKLLRSAHVRFDVKPQLVALLPSPPTDR